MTLGFKVNLKEKPLTRREVLSTLSSIYDPLGFDAPFLLQGKQILQKLCHLNLKWDEHIPDETSNEWLSWKENLSNLEIVYLGRCFKAHGFGKVVDCSLQPAKMVMAKQVTFALYVKKEEFSAVL